VKSDILFTLRVLMQATGFTGSCLYPRDIYRPSQNIFTIHVYMNSKYILGRDKQDPVDFTTKVAVFACVTLKCVNFKWFQLFGIVFTFPNELSI